jgi:hypothetical protein
VELSLDRHVEENEAETARVRDYPLQASLLLYPVHSTFSPYFLVGYGWYRQRVDQLSDGDVVQTVATLRSGSHAGIGAEIRAGRHIGIHADYRYTFLHFGSDSEGRSSITLPGASFLHLPSYEGSMWATGVTIYF